MKKQMFYNAGATIFERAKKLRNQPTDAERILWMHLRTKPSGYKFRRQHPALNYILDFYCHSLKLAIEVDGSIHEQENVAKADIESQKELESIGIFFLRFNNEQIMMQMDNVIETIDVAIDESIFKGSITSLNL